jgi:hypothetical protein
MGKCRDRSGYPSDYYRNCGLDAAPWLTADDYLQPGESYYRAYIRLRNKYGEELQEFLEEIQLKHAELYGTLLIDDLRKRSDYRDDLHSVSADALILATWYNTLMRVALNNRGGATSSGSFWVACPIKFDQADCETKAFNAQAGILGFARKGWKFIHDEYDRKLAAKRAKEGAARYEQQSSEIRQAQEQVIRESAEEWAAVAKEREEKRLARIHATERGELIGKAALVLVVLGCVGVGGYVAWKKGYVPWR